jgi:hypothetical protein
MRCGEHARAGLLPTPSLRARETGTVLAVDFLVRYLVVEGLMQASAPGVTIQPAYEWLLTAPQAGYTIMPRASRRYGTA